MMGNLKGYNLNGMSLNLLITTEDEWTSQVGFATICLRSPPPPKKKKKITASNPYITFLRKIRFLVYIFCFSFFGGGFLNKQ